MKKQGLVAQALVVTTAAIANFLAPVPHPIDSPMASAPRASSVHASFEIRQAPVPIVMKPRPPLEQPTFDADVATPAVVSALFDRVGDSAATRVIKVASVNDASGANGRYANGQPTAGGTRWAP